MRYANCWTQALHMPVTDICNLIRIDESRPQCRLCVLSNFSCEYPDVVFIDNSAVVKASTATQQQDRFKPNTPNEALVAPDQGCHLTHRMLESCLVNELWHSFSKSKSSATLQAWPGFLADNGDFPLGRKCLLTLANTYIGNEWQDDTLTVRGRQLYVESMQSLRYALGRQRCLTTNDIILSITILSLYEMIVFSSEDAWINHALGLARVLELRAPATLQTAIGHQLFEANRFIICLASLATSRPTFLSQSRWKSEPWSDDNSKDSLETLVDSFADLATLNAQIVSSPRTDRARFRAKVLRILEELSQWKGASDHWSHGQVVEAISSEHSTPAVMPMALCFPTVYITNSVCVYNAAVIQTIVLLKRCSDGHSESRDTARKQAVGDGVDDDDEYDAKAHQAGVEICMTAQGCLPQAFTDSSLQFMLLYPLRMAWLSLEKDYTGQRHWIESLLGCFASRKGPWSVIRQVLANSLPAKR